MAIKIDDFIETNKGRAKIRKIGTRQYGERGGRSWRMLTLDLHGEPAYTAVLDDEVASADRDIADAQP